MKKVFIRGFRRFTQIAQAGGNFLSSLSGLVHFGGATHRLKRWAIVGRPCRDFNGDGVGASVRPKGSGQRTPSFVRALRRAGSRGQRGSSAPARLRASGRGGSKAEGRGQKKGRNRGEVSVRKVLLANE
jgi:hypothetical protein